MLKNGKLRDVHAAERRRMGRVSTLPIVLLAVASTALASCSESLPSLPKLNDINPFAEKQKPLPGKRVAIVTDSTSTGIELAAADRPMAIAAFTGNEAWTQPGGTPNNAPGHLALAASVKIGWSGDAGTGSSKYGKLSASPIVVGGKVYTLDAAGIVTAFAVAGGGQAWRASVKPDAVKIAEKGYGGGLASADGKLFVATGYGTMVALDPANGKKLWEHNVGIPMRTSPTAADGRVLAVTIEGELVALSAEDGNEQWRYRGIGEKASIVSNASPAIEGSIAVVPFTSGEVVGVNLQTGAAVWNENLTRGQSSSSLASMTDAARPTIDNGTVFAIGHAGRMTALTLRGEPLWSAPVPGIQQPVASGDSVFVVDTAGQLMALTRKDGKVQWTTKLAGSSVWSGPVLAGGRLWLTGANGQLVGVDAVTGKIASTLELGSPVFIAPIVASGRMFVLTDKARLISLN